MGLFSKRISKTREKSQQFSEDMIIPKTSLSQKEAIDGKVDTQDLSKQAMFGLYAWIYESESQRISDRIKSVYQMKYKSGKFMGSTPHMVIPFRKEN